MARPNGDILALATMFDAIMMREGKTVIQELLALHHSFQSNVVIPARRGGVVTSSNPSRSLLLCFTNALATCLTSTQSH